uniref:Uncharacterized protein n=1 Tax=Arundo donax TaxID=35708 RepID=A0A0A9DZL0_ARUDO
MKHLYFNQLQIECFLNFITFLASLYTNLMTELLSIT